MIKNLVEDLILIGLLVLAAFLAWKYYFRALLLAGVEKTAAVAKEYVADVKTVGGVVAYPLDTATDFWKAVTAPAYISQDAQREAIAKIQAQLKGKMS